MTGNSCLLDTSIVIHAFKSTSITKQIQEFSKIFISSIAVGELYYGAYRSQNIAKHLGQVNEFIKSCTLLNTDLDTSDIYGKIKATLKSKGKPIPENDIWIAAVSAQYNLPLFTTDRHFEEIDIITLIGL